jgi:septum formation inhibitor-activating ATPase MinD
MRLLNITALALGASLATAGESVLQLNSEFVLRLLILLLGLPEKIFSIFKKRIVILGS